MTTREETHVYSSSSFASGNLMNSFSKYYIHSKKKKIFKPQVGIIIYHMTAQSTMQDQANYSAAVIRETNLKLPIFTVQREQPSRV